MSAASASTACARRRRGGRRRRAPGLGDRRREQAREARHEMRGVLVGGRLRSDVGRRLALLGGKFAAQAGHGGREIAGHQRPQPRQQGIGRRRGRRAVRRGARHRHQVQAAHRARDGDIQHARRFVVGALALQPLQEIVQRRLALAAPAPAIDRRHQQALAAFQRQAVPGQQRRFLRRRPRCRPGRITVSNSRPLALWMVISCRRPSARASGAANRRAMSSSRLSSAKRPAASSASRR
jgi:hypothetical protein